jgi:hypothetical protein
VVGDSDAISTQTDQLGRDGTDRPKLPPMKDELITLAACQHGLLTLPQVRAARHEHLIRQRLRSGEWVREQPLVVRPALWEPTFTARITAVRLAVAAAGQATGWCFSHTTGARLLNLKVPASDELHVLLPVSRRGLALRDVHRHFTYKPFRVITVVDDPAPFLGPLLLQCATVLTRSDLLTLVEDLLRQERITLDYLRSFCGRGVSGSAAIRSVHEELRLEGTDKWMRRLVPLLVSAGLPKPALEVPIRDGSRLKFVLDGLWEDAGLALEIDDWATHGSRGASERDNQRDRWLFEHRDLVTFRTTPREIRDDPNKVVSDAVRAYRRGLERRRRS